MNTQRIAALIGNGFWVEPDGGDTAKVGVVRNMTAGQVEEDLRRLKTELAAKGYKSRKTGRGVFTLLRVWQTA
jgi:hypothetical protein